MKLKILIGLLLLLVPCVVAGPVGCEWYNASVGHCWNQGDIEPDTYIMRDCSQMANRNVSRFGWMSYEMGLAWWRNDSVTKFPLDCSSVTPVYSSDDLTYWQIEWHKQITMGGKVANLTYSLSQTVNASYVNASLTFHSVSGFEAFTKNITLYRLMKNVDVDLDGDFEILELENDNQRFHLRMNHSRYAHGNNLTWPSLKIYDEDTGHHVQWVWRGRNYQAKFLPSVTGENGKVYFYKEFQPPPGGLGNNFTKKVSHWWIDAQGTFLPVSAKTGQIQTNGLWFTVYTGGSSYNVYKCRTTPTERRLYYNYDTASIPDYGSVTGVGFRHTVLLTSNPPPVSWQTDFDIGTFIGVALDQTDWNGGTNVYTEIWPTSPFSKTIEMTSASFKHINKMGFTDLKLKDASLWDFSSPNCWGHTIYSNSRRGGQLYVNWTFRVNVSDVQIVNDVPLSEPSGFLVWGNFSDASPGAVRNHLNSSVVVYNNGVPLISRSLNYTFILPLNGTNLTLDRRSPTTNTLGAVYVDSYYGLGLLADSGRVLSYNKNNLNRYNGSWCWVGNYTKTTTGTTNLMRYFNGVRNRILIRIYSDGANTGLVTMYEGLNDDVVHDTLIPDRGYIDVCFTWEDGETVDTYINGKLNQTSAFPTVMNEGVDIDIGNAAGTIQGTIDNIALIPFAMSAEEIAFRHKLNNTWRSVDSYFNMTTIGGVCGLYTAEATVWSTEGLGSLSANSTTKSWSCPSVGVVSYKPRLFGKMFNMGWFKWK